MYVHTRTKIRPREISNTMHAMKQNNNCMLLEIKVGEYILNTLVLKFLKGLKKYIKDLHFIQNEASLPSPAPIPVCSGICTTLMWTKDPEYTEVLNWIPFGKI